MKEDIEQSEYKDCGVCGKSSQQKRHSNAENVARYATHIEHFSAMILNLNIARR
jgi:putative methionine-R-sulfoxide reductase with GAF domain